MRYAVQIPFINLIIKTMKKLFTLLLIVFAISAYATNVTFEVSLKGSGQATDSVYVVGNATDWLMVEMDDMGDSLFSTTMNITSGDTVVYYFITVGWWAPDYQQYREVVPLDCDDSQELVGWEGDRAFIVGSSPMTVSYTWGTCEPAVEAPNAIRGEIETGFGFELYPNPAVDQVNIILNSSSANTRVELLEISGKSIRSFAISENQVTIDVSDLAAGVYFAKVQDGENIQIKKLVVQ